MVGYPLKPIYEEVAYIAYHFHWSPELLMAMEHRERQRWVEEVAEINRRLNAESEGGREWMSG
ncbi:DUF6760 family protein [Leptothermofonsia sichuanensis]|uniref:DUF6760 family protein n=1 Tax=Leptothermofonsia sichuanensis TaxID=2917832 RepID=UPI0028F41882|nr:DUF6760 family protein [Leptothermofonsia sichuanensis]